MAKYLENCPDCGDPMPVPSWKRCDFCAESRRTFQWRDYQKEWRRKNPEKYKAYQKAYRKKKKGGIMLDE